jgi:NDP-sugar pyrophosphorylase family protein
LPVSADCEAVILAGGLGTRMREISGDAVSKVLLPVAGVPVIDRILRLTAREGMTLALLCVGHRRDDVMKYCGDGGKWGLHIDYSIETAPLGTGGAVLHALGKVGTSSILVLNGDTLLEGGLQDMVKLHLLRDRRPVIGVVRADDRSRYGSVTVDEAGMVTVFSEKSSSSAGLIYAGCCVLSVDCLSGWDAPASGGSVSLERDILPALVRSGRVYAQVLQGFFLDTGTPDDYRKAGLLFGGHE